MTTPAPFKEISLDDLKQGLRDGALLLVDVREAAEYEAGHIAGALFNPLSAFDPAAIPQAPEGKRVVLYCRSGRRSVSAMEMAKLAGRADLDTHFAGGMLGWLADNQPVATGL